MVNRRSVIVLAIYARKCCCPQITDIATRIPIMVVNLPILEALISKDLSLINHEMTVTLARSSWALSILSSLVIYVNGHSIGLGSVAW